MFKNLFLILIAILSSSVQSGRPKYDTKAYVMSDAVYLSYAAGAANRCEKIEDPTICNLAIFYKPGVKCYNSDKVCEFYEQLYNAKGLTNKKEVAACRWVFDEGKNLTDFSSGRCEPAYALGVPTRGVRPDRYGTPIRVGDEITFLFDGKNSSDQFKKFCSRNDKWLLGDKETKCEYKEVHQEELDCKRFELNYLTVSAFAHTQQNGECKIQVVKAKKGDADIADMFVYSNYDLGFVKLAYKADSAKYGAANSGDELTPERYQGFCGDVTQKFYINSDVELVRAATMSKDYMASLNLNRVRFSYMDQANLNKLYPSDFRQAYMMNQNHCFGDMTQVRKNEKTQITVNKHSTRLCGIVRRIKDGDYTGDEKERVSTVPELYLKTLYFHLGAYSEECEVTTDAGRILPDAGEILPDDVKDNSGNMTKNFLKNLVGFFITSAYAENKGTPSWTYYEQALGADNAANNPAGGGGGGGKTGVCSDPSTNWQTFRCSITGDTVSNAAQGGFGLWYQFKEAGRAYERWKQEMEFARQQFQEGQCFPYKPDPAKPADATTSMTVPLTIAGVTKEYSMYDFCKLSASGALNYVDACATLAANKNVPRAAVLKCYNITGKKGTYPGSSTPPVVAAVDTNNNNAEKKAEEKEKEKAAAAATTAGAGAGAAAGKGGGDDEKKKQRSPYDQFFSPYSSYGGRQAMQQSSGGGWPYGAYDANQQQQQTASTTSIPKMALSGEWGFIGQVNSHLTTGKDVLVTGSK
ncbi:MAG: hypothetical protein V1647_05445 [Pseudomonadota bacterium]